MTFFIKWLFPTTPEIPSELASYKTSKWEATTYTLSESTKEAS